MGEYADMILDGTMDEESGEYIGDINKDIFGTSSPGFPINYDRQGQGNKEKVKCPTCGKRVKRIGLAQHLRDKH